MQSPQLADYSFWLQSLFWWLYWVGLWVALAFWTAHVAERKGHSFLFFFVLSLFFFPLALLVAYFVKDSSTPVVHSR